MKRLLAVAFAGLMSFGLAQAKDDHWRRHSDMPRNSHVYYSPYYGAYNNGYYGNDYGYGRMYRNSSYRRWHRRSVSPYMMRRTGAPAYYGNPYNPYWR